MSTQSSLLALCALLGPALTGCASTNALRLSIAERDAEIRDLRSEKALLTDELECVITRWLRSSAAGGLRYWKT